jgi:hypothetical protein
MENIVEMSKFKDEIGGREGGRREGRKKEGRKEGRNKNKNCRILYIRERNRS